MRSPRFALAALLFTAPAHAFGDVDLTLEAVSSFAVVGDIVEVRLRAAAQDLTPTDIGSLDALVAYDPAVLQLLGHDSTNAGYSWFVAGFLTDPDGINGSLADGDALFTALAQFSGPASPPLAPGFEVTTLRFLALAPSGGTTVQLLPSLGTFGTTQVLDFFVPGLDLTGDIASTASVTIGGVTAFCIGTPAACPCANVGAGVQGCANSTGVGAQLGAAGSTGVGAGDLVLAATGLAPGQPGLYLQGDNRINGGLGVVLGDGLRCAGGNVRRLQIRQASPAGASNTTVNVAAQGLVAPGDVRRYQLWYRDPLASPCLQGFNLSNGLEVVWVP